MTKNYRLIGIDILRILSAFVVFLFHSRVHLHCSFGVLTGFVEMGAIFMTAFFMLSGFVLLYTNSACNEKYMISSVRGGVMQFYKKRFVSIVPLYWAVGVLFVVYDFLLSRNSLFENLVLLPIEIFGMQSIFSSLFAFSHNGGTWFISCILICYAVFPLLEMLVCNFSFRQKILFVSFFVFMLLFSPIVVHIFDLQSIYSNPFFRFFEFTIGVLLCSILQQNSAIGVLGFLNRMLQNWIAFFIEFIVLIFAVTICSLKGIGVGNYMLYNWIALPLFIMMLFTLSGITSEKLGSSKLLKYMSEISYAFFLAQFFTWEPIAFVFRKMDWVNNLLKICMSFLLCILITVLLHETVEKPLKKLSKKIVFSEAK